MIIHPQHLFLSSYLAMYYRSIQVFRVELECNVCDKLTYSHSAHSVSLDVSQLFFTPDVGTWIKLSSLDCTLSSVSFAYNKSNDCSLHWLSDH